MALSKAEKQELDKYREHYETANAELGLVAGNTGLILEKMGGLEVSQKEVKEDIKDMKVDIKETRVICYNNKENIVKMVTKNRILAKIHGAIWKLALIVIGAGAGYVITLVV